MDLKIAGLRKVESVPLTDDVVGAKLAGCTGCSVGSLLSRIRPNLGNGVSGIFVAADGVATDPIALSELVQGWLIHSDAIGSAELPKSLGGPLRVVFPPGVAIQNSVCGTPKPINLKGAIRLELASTFELQDAKISKELGDGAPRLIAQLEEFHSASLLAFAKYYCNVQCPARVAIAAVDARGFTLRVTTSDGHVLDALLAPFPRPLTSAADAYPLAMVMHRTAYAELGLAFKLQSRYYSEPVVVGLRMAYRQSPYAVLATAAIATTAAAAVLLARGRVRGASR